MDAIAHRGTLLLKNDSRPLFTIAYDTIREAQQGVTRYLTFYNQVRPHRALDGRTPDRVYWASVSARRTAA